jgi:hypothetical protein
MAGLLELQDMSRFSSGEKVERKWRESGEKVAA